MDFKTGPTLNTEIEITKGPMTIKVLNAIENSKNIECISYSSLYGFVFRVQLAEENRGDFRSVTSHNSVVIKVATSNGTDPTHIALKFTVLVEDGDDVQIADCLDVYSGEKYIKNANTVNGFNNEVTNQKNIYKKTKGRNGIAICPNIFHSHSFENTDAIEFLEFFDKNISDNVCTYVVKYLLDRMTEPSTYKLGFIAMEYVQLGDESESGKMRDTRITLYKFLTYYDRVQPSKKSEEIVDRLIEILPTLKKEPMFLYNIDIYQKNTKRETNTSSKPIYEFKLSNETIYENYNYTTKDQNNQLEYQLEYLRLNYYKFRILAHVIYYMLRAYDAGYIHNDLHSNNIFVVNPYLTNNKDQKVYNGCLHPFSLNDVGIAELNEPTRNFQQFLFTNFNNNIGNYIKHCNIIQNYCNFSCIQIIDWGRTVDASKFNVKSENSNTESTDENNKSDIEIKDVFNMVKKLQSIYKDYSYIFDRVGLNSQIQNIEDLQYPQFYVIWLIWNEYYKKKITKKNEEKEEEEIKEIEEQDQIQNSFYEFLTVFKTNCEYNTFYETITY